MALTVIGAAGITAAPLHAELRDPLRRRIAAAANAGPLPFSSAAASALLSSSCGSGDDAAASPPAAYETCGCLARVSERRVCVLAPPRRDKFHLSC